MSEEQNEDEEIVLSELSDSELVEQMFDDLYDGLADEIAEGAGETDICRNLRLACRRW